MRRPVIALLANLFVPPLGHFYVGEARRGVLLWLGTVVGASVGFLFLVLFLSGPAAVAAIVGMAILLGLLLPLDAFLIARRRMADHVPRPYNRWFAYLAVAVLSLLVGGFIRDAMRINVQAFRIPSEAMTPTLAVGDYLYIDKLSQRWRGTRRGDIVVFPFPPDPTKDFIKRVIAMGGESIEIRDKQVIVNGIPLDEPYKIHSDQRLLPAGLEYRDNFGPYTVPEGELFVMGDNRDNSNDSRYWGTLAAPKVKGTAALIYWSWDGGASRPRWDRLGMRIR